MYRDSKEAALLPKEYAFKVQVGTRVCCSKRQRCFSKPQRCMPYDMG